MNKTKILFTTALAAAVATGVAVKSNDAQAAGEKEKCYGVAKAGANDCGTAVHSCAAQSKADNAGDEWVFVPKGLCERLTGGSLSPKE